MLNRPARPSVRLRAVPPLDPPFDDESGAAWGLGQLALDLPSTGRPAARPVGQPPGSRRPPEPPRPAAEAPTIATVEARKATRRFLVICLEILNGYRPVSHVRPLTGKGETEAIVGQLAAAVKRLPGPGLTGRTTPGLAPRQGHRPGGRRDLAQLRRVRVCEPRVGVAEAAAVLATGGRTWAMAFRVERRQGAWVTTALRVL